MLFISSLNWTDQGIRNVKDAPKRAIGRQGGRIHAANAEGGGLEVEILLPLA